jgi:citrate lyase subunit beta/citryl-CoA lyase
MVQQLDVYDADSVILDLEDSVMEFEKDSARILVKNFLKQISPKNVKLFIRINDQSTPHFAEDIRSMQKLDIFGFVIPKANLETIQNVVTVTKKPLLPIIETPMGVLEAREMVQFQQVIGLLLGAEDLTKEMNVKRSKEGVEINYARSYIAMVCHAYKKEAIDTPWVHKEDLEGLKKDAMYAKRLGFTGKSLIHPLHVDIVNQVFFPSEEEINEAKRIVTKAKTEQRGAFTLDGKMVDKPVIERAQKLLKTCEMYTRK